MILLSSLQRLRRYIDLKDNVTNNRNLMTLLMASSKNIQRFLGRELLKQSYTEYFDVDSNRVNYFPKAYPIESITSVYSDSTGLYDGSEFEETQYYIGTYNRSVVLDTPVQMAEKGLRIIYTGGISEHGTRSTLALTGVSGTFTAGKFVTGSLSGAMGIVVTTTGATPLVVETIMGAWEVGDVLTLQDTEGGADVGGIGATVSALTIQSLCETEPEISMACDMQVRYDWKHKWDFENAGVNKDSTTFRRTEKKLQYSNIYFGLQPEVRSLLNSHKRISL